MTKKKTGILLINLGTPNSPSVPDVRRYLFEFLNDKRVIDLPWLGRKLLVNGVIVPFRSPKSAELYKELFDLSDNLSPLLKYGESLTQKVQETLGDDYVVKLAMRYQNPPMDSVLKELDKEELNKLIVVPLYPQYATSTTYSTIEKFEALTQDWNKDYPIEIVKEFYNEPAFIDSFSSIGKEFNVEDYDEVLFSYHGLPVRQLERLTPENYHFCKESRCDEGVNESNSFCYKAQCFETTKQLVEKLNIPEGKYRTVFQSRLGSAKWIQPYAEETIIKLAEEGKKKLLVFSPAFVADCLETIIEIGDEYQEIFEEKGGKEITLVPSLNDNPVWVKNLSSFLKQKAINN